MNPLVILFAKAPVPGQVKTRLQGVLGPRATVALYEAMVRDIALKLNELEFSCGIQLHLDRPFNGWQEIRFERRIQVPGDLGVKMLAALQAGFKEGYNPVAILGTDCPHLPLPYLRELLVSTADVALGPTRDGGFYAISCRRVHPRMFAGVPWSTQSTLQQTIEQCQACGLSVELGSECFDIDEAEDLRMLLQQGTIPPHVRAWAQEYAGLVKRLLAVR